MLLHTFSLVSRSNFELFHNPVFSVVVVFVVVGLTGGVEEWFARVASGSVVSGGFCFLMSASCNFQKVKSAV